MLIQKISSIRKSFNMSSELIEIHWKAQKDCSTQVNGIFESWISWTRINVSESRFGWELDGGWVLCQLISNRGYSIFTAFW